jgi:hypothetical protein
VGVPRIAVHKTSIAGPEPRQRFLGGARRLLGRFGRQSQTRRGKTDPNDASSGQ